MKKILTAIAATVAVNAAAYQLDIATDRPGAPIQPTMYGLFFEDINYAADGGLYAELVKNRSFEFPQHFMGWQTSGNVTLLDDGPFERNPHYVRLSPAGHPHKRTAIVNEGYFGVTMREGEEYRFSVWARNAGNTPGRISVELIDPASAGETQVEARGTIKPTGTDWKKYTLTLTPGRTVREGQLRLMLDPKSGPVDLEHISLFPADTWNGDENGLRADIAGLLADLKPGVLRFPGGCIVEGTDLDTRYQWKNSVGPIENRPLNENRWHYTFPHRYFPDYFQSYGLGFYEFFRFAEQIGAAPLPIISVGLACQFQNNSEDAHVAVDSLQPYIQDALDLIEFANGDTTTVWGALRASMGHPEPFGLRHLGIGNEQWGEEYPARLAPFIEAIRKVHPEIAIVGSSGPGSEGDKFEYLWPEMRRLKVDLVDEHFYRPEEWFLSQGARYDNYDRKGPKVFAGEYACHGKGKKYNHFNAALLEAAFMTGLERNADVVHMATYAPLLAHTKGWQWRPDLVWFDNLSAARSSSYYVQQLYSHNKGSRVLQLTCDGKPLTGADGVFASAVIDEPSGDCIVKVANTTGQEMPLTFNMTGKRHKAADYSSLTVTTLASTDPDIDNEVGQPEVITPVTETVGIEKEKPYTTAIAPMTFAVYRFSR